MLKYLSLIVHQDILPPGHGFIGVISASNKTPLTMGSGNKKMHPLLLSIANIHAGVCMKATSQAYALVAYLPIPKFLNVSPAVQSIQKKNGRSGVTPPSLVMESSGYMLRA